MKIRFCLFALIASICAFSASAQDDNQPKGKAIIQVFTNFHSGFGNDRNDLGFALDRSYLGYQYDLGKGLSIKAVMDIGQSSDVDDYHRIVYIKNAQVTWKTGNLTLDGGLISNTQFRTQEKHWGYRYIMKSFQDQYKFGSSADLGLSATYKFAPWFAADAIIVNGEGYKKIQKLDGLQYGLGLTFTSVKGLTLRLYSSLNQSAVADTKDTYNYAAFAGYANEHFSLGAEYNMQQNTSNVANKDLYGYSVYGSVTVSKMVNIFARYDLLQSRHDWNLGKDESAVIAGAQVKLGRYVKVAPNFRMSIPAVNPCDGNRYSAYISCFFGL